MSKEIQNLVRSAVAGDLDSFGELATRYYAAMVSIAYAICGDRHLAEDAAQEALARALVRLQTLQRPDRFGPWLCRICRNVAHDMLAHRARQASNEDISRVRQPVGTDDDTGPVKEAVAALSEPARELVILRYYNDLSYEQISEVLGISRAAINGRLTRAKRKLAAYLKRHGYPETSK